MKQLISDLGQHKYVTVVSVGALQTVLSAVLQSSATFHGRHSWEHAEIVCKNNKLLSCIGEQEFLSMGGHSWAAVLSDDLCDLLVAADNLPPSRYLQWLSETVSKEYDRHS